MPASLASLAATVKSRPTRSHLRVGHQSGGGNGAVGDDENMGGRLRMDVPKGRYQFVLIENVGGNLPPDDFYCKDGIFCHAFPLIWNAAF